MSIFFVHLGQFEQSPLNTSVTSPVNKYPINSAVATEEKPLTTEVMKCNKNTTDDLRDASGMYAGIPGVAFSEVQN
ncbi:hypothetical protein evm_015200 [Chilo suppressalis]|nr:hypothetical protein evm_015200 [Chilo suppressalis]